jgi:hypothetical protein
MEIGEPTHIITIEPIELPEEAPIEAPEEAPDREHEPELVPA